MQMKLNKIADLLGLFVDSEKKLKFSERLLKVLESLDECWSVFISIFRIPQCKLTSVLDQLTSQVYKLALNVIFKPANAANKDEAMDRLLEVIKGHFTMLKGQKHTFSEGLTFILSGILHNTAHSSDSKWTKPAVKQTLKYIAHLRASTKHSQVLVNELEALLIKAQKKSEATKKLLGKRKQMDDVQPLQHLSLIAAKPKPLPSYPPLVEDEFLFRINKKDNMDSKELKKKTKKAEKDAVRELKKDNLFIQKQRQDD
eukprot:CAMPEP_0170497834 /NCGR_PEP_ID=MMETSP0208-20121228/25973_1 /TAXON_ID=197538 /ORGANISM="Strombidium inclinatum, Strain S3" /LENGTH=256 /DNA_ID=CAMNT_0010774781 /DNA_START=438 /DNA_END=1205 /DNA_ORIENTATION=-